MATEDGLEVVSFSATLFVKKHVTAILVIYGAVVVAVLGCQNDGSN